MTPSAIAPQSQEEQLAAARAFGEKFGPAFDDLLDGHPQKMIEGFLSIDDKEQARIVPFILNRNQQFIMDEVFDYIGHWSDGLDEVWLKDRQATFTSLMQGVGFAFVVNLPNIHAVHVFQDVDTGKQLMDRLGLFWDRLDPLVLNHDGRVIKRTGDSRTELTLEFWEEGKLVGTSSYLIVSAGSREFGSGIAPNFIILDEYDLYPNLDLVGRLEEGKAPNCKLFKISTPRGMKQLHTDYFAAKEGRSGAHAVAVYCFQNSRNSMEEGHRLAPPKFRGGFDLLPEHRRILESSEWAERTAFRTEEEVKGFFRWWEWKRQGIRQRLAALGIFDEKRVLGEMEAEHCSNDRTCWHNLGVTPFDTEVLDDYTDWAKKSNEKLKRKPESIGVPGVAVYMIDSPQPGMAYACGVDCAWGQGAGDDVVAYIKDAAGNYACTLRGQGTFDLVAYTKALVGLLWEYGKGEWEPLLAPEVDGKLGILMIEVARMMGYRNFWKVPQKPGENYDKYSLNPDKLGWRTQNNKEDMLQTLIAKCNNRHMRILDLGFLRDAGNYDPKTQKHTADNLMAAAITEMITNADNMNGFGRQFAKMAAQVRNGRMGAAPTVARVMVIQGGMLSGQRGY